MADVAFSAAGAAYPCGIDFEEMLIAISSIVFGFLLLPQARHADPAKLAATHEANGLCKRTTTAQCTNCIIITPYSARPHRLTATSAFRAM
eukprot:3297326-Prymnesium_polylepis.1